VSISLLEREDGVSRRESCEQYATDESQELTQKVKVMMVDDVVANHAHFMDPKEEYTEPDLINNAGL
jgi:hypothetical protein